MRDERRWTVAPDSFKLAQLEKLVEAERHDTEISSQASKLVERQETGEASAPIINKNIDSYPKTRFGSQMSPISPMDKRARQMKRRPQNLPKEALASNQVLFEQLNLEIERSQMA